MLKTVFLVTTIFYLEESPDAITRYGRRTRFENSRSQSRRSELPNGEKINKKRLEGCSFRVVHERFVLNACTRVLVFFRRDTRVTHSDRGFSRFASVWKADRNSCAVDLGRFPADPSASSERKTAEPRTRRRR